MALLLPTKAGNTVDGKAFADAALRDRLAPEHEAEIHMRVAQMYDPVAGNPRSTTGSAALALPELTVVLRARHLSELVVSVLSSGEAGGRPSADCHVPKTAVAHPLVDAVANHRDNRRPPEMRVGRTWKGSFHRHHFGRFESSLRQTLRRTRRPPRPRESTSFAPTSSSQTDDFDAAHHDGAPGS